jgi:hypothetical protein
MSATDVGVNRSAKILALQRGAKARAYIICASVEQFGDMFPDELACGGCGVYGIGRLGHKGAVGSRCKPGG